ncbi:MAG: hypothetical protein ACP5FH_05450 [Terracidiphilus sp.]
MTEFLPDSCENCRPKPRALGAAGLLCVALLALLAVIQVAHVHAIGSDTDHCPLCVAMHSAAPVAVVAAPVVLVRIALPAPVFEARPLVRYWRPKLFIRPPPSGC